MDDPMRDPDLLAIVDPEVLECACPPKTGDERYASYTIGCPRHTAMALQAAPSVSRTTATAHTVTYFHAAATVHIPVAHVNDHGQVEVWSQDASVDCKHNHVHPEQAERCAEKLARARVVELMRSGESRNTVGS